MKNKNKTEKQLLQNPMSLQNDKKNKSSEIDTVKIAGKNKFGEVSAEFREHNAAERFFDFCVKAIAIFTTGKIANKIIDVVFHKPKTDK